MSASGQWFVASTEGSSFTLYAMMKKFGIPLSERQERIQKQLEKLYPAVIYSHKEE